MNNTIKHINITEMQLDGTQQAIKKVMDPLDFYQEFFFILKPDESIKGVLCKKIPGNRSKGGRGEV